MSHTSDNRQAAELFISDLSRVDALTDLAIRSAESVWRLTEELQHVPGVRWRLNGDVSGEEHFHLHLLEIQELADEWRGLGQTDGWDSFLRALFDAVEIRAGEQPTITIWGAERRGGYRVALGVIRRILAEGPLSITVADLDELKAGMGRIRRIGPVTSLAALHNRIKFEQLALERWLKAAAPATPVFPIQPLQDPPPDFADLLAFLGAAENDERPAQWFSRNREIEITPGAFRQAARGRITSRPGPKTGRTTPPNLYVVGEVLSKMPRYREAVREAMVRRA